MIFFDLDNTLLDHDKSEESAIIALCEGKKINVSQSEVSLLWKKISKKYYERYLAGDLSFEKQRLLRMKEFFSLIENKDSNGLNQSEHEMDDSEAEKLFREYLKNYEKNWVVFEDVVPTLEKLQDFRLGVISNGQTDQQYKKLISLNIDKYFELVVTSHDLGVSKPNPHIFKRAAEIACVDEKQCVYIGDDLIKDIMPSQEIGMFALWINRNSENVPSKNVMSIKDLRDSIDIINQHYNNQTFSLRI